jgi:Protein of unknown function (DUF1501)
MFDDFPCRRQSQSITRRGFLNRWGMGFGSVALACMLHEDRVRAEGSRGVLSDLHHPARAKHVIFLYMDGGPAQMDTFDPKPMLTKYNGQPFPTKMEPTQFSNNGNTLGSPWKFNQYGESGLWISDLFPNLSKHADKLSVIRSMTSQFSEHTSANYFLHTGLGIVGRPSMGAWSVYGLGTESSSLPGFVVINGGLTPPGGLDNFASGFLPATYQASIFAPTGDAIANLSGKLDRDAQRLVMKRKLLQQLDEQYAAATGHADPIESAIKNYQLAYRMQESVPEASNLNTESAATQAMYGIDHANKPTAIFARECLLARRLVERGVRFVELTCPSVGHDRWDQHNNLKDGHEKNSLAVDQPIAALLQDLNDRGLLDETLVVWAGEFGRTPFAQGTNGRDHNPFAFSLWLAGGGVKGGAVYGATDEFGYKAIEGKSEIHDLHATMLHLLGIDHERLTFRFGGRDHRLTDIHGHVLTDVIS